MFNLEAKAATLLGAYQGAADLIETLACLEGQSDVPDEDVALAMAHLSRAMAALSAARSFCVDLAQRPSKEDLDRDVDDLLKRCTTGHASDCGCFACITAGSEDALALAQQVGLEAVEDALDEEPLSAEDQALIERAWQQHVAASPKAKAVDEALGEEVKP